MSKTVRIQQKTKKETSDGINTDTNDLTFWEMFNPATCAGGRLLYDLQIFALLFMYFFNCVGGEQVAGKFVGAFSIDHFGFQLVRVLTSIPSRLVSQWAFCRIPHNWVDSNSFSDSSRNWSSSSNHHTVFL